MQLLPSLLGLLVIGCFVPHVAANRVSDVLSSSHRWQPLKILPEKTIWLFWEAGFDPPPNGVVMLCSASIRKTNPDWNIEFVSNANAYQYLSPGQLPSAWHQIPNPKLKKDTILASLMAVYGGVWLDSTVIVFESLTPWWNDMLKHDIALHSYWYRMEKTHEIAEALALWFMMVKRSSAIFQTYAHIIIESFGDGISFERQGADGLAMGLYVLAPLVRQANASLPLCPPTIVGCDGPPAVVQGRVGANLPSMANLKIRVSDPKNDRDGPEVEFFDHNQDGLEYQTEEVKMADAMTEAWWNEFSTKRRNGMKMLKLFHHGGMWAPKQTAEHLLLPAGTTFPEENMFSLMFKGAGLTREELFASELGTDQGNQTTEEPIQDKLTGLNNLIVKK
jgi:hypothetical protein